MASMIKCTFAGCQKTSEQPTKDGWAHLLGWGPGIADGYYCQAHADALEEVHLEGGLEDPENDLAH
jgi:hypothetical protein